MAIILLFSFGLCFGILFGYGQSWRNAFVFAMIGWGVIAIFMTEVLGAFYLLTYRNLLTSWLMVFSSLVVWFWLVFFNFKKKFFKLINGVDFSWRKYWDVISLIVIAALIGFTGLIYAPNSWDSLSYHLPRIVHWLQNRTLEHYPTGILRQLFMSPGSEFLMLHVITLGGNEKLASLIQWFAMVGCIIVASLIARQFGLNKMGQTLASVLVLSIPVGILEASGTLSDYVVSFWLMCFMLFALRYIVGDDSRINLLGLGASLGLSILTKSVAVVYVIPILVWMFVARFSLDRYRVVLSFIFIALISVTINLGHFSRNYSTFGSFLSPPQVTSYYINGTFSSRAILSNVVRNATLHLNTPFERFDELVTEGVKRFHVLLDINLNDPRTTEMKGDFYRLSTPYRHEAYAGNPIHFVLILLSVGLYFIRVRYLVDLNTRRLGSLYPFVLSFSFILFSVIFKWSSQNARYHLPFFVLLAPYVAVVIAYCLSVKGIRNVMAMLLLYSLPWVFFNLSRPLISPDYIKMMINDTGSASLSSVFGKDVPYGIFSGETSQLFREFQPLQEPLVAAVDYLDTHFPLCTNIGFVSGYEELEYHFWELIKSSAFSGIRIEHVMVENESRRMAEKFPPFNPCVIVSLKPEDENSFSINNNIFYRMYTSSSADGSVSVSIYSR